MKESTKEKLEIGAIVVGCASTAGTLTIMILKLLKERRRRKEARAKKRLLATSK